MDSFSAIFNLSGLVWHFFTKCRCCPLFISFSSSSLYNINKRNLQALTNRSASDNRPSCLVLDEIDGIHNSASKYLLSRIQAQNVKKKAKKDAGPLLRPIICICNDPYVPSLRELRKEALILHFNGIDRSRLTARLEEVCRMNQVEVRYV